MKVKIAYDRKDTTCVRVAPWPDEPFSAEIDAKHTRINYSDREDFPYRPGDVGVRFDTQWLSPQVAREFAAAILLACSIADDMAAGTFDPTRFSEIGSNTHPDNLPPTDARAL